MAIKKTPESNPKLSQNPQKNSPSLNEVPCCRGRETCSFDSAKTTLTPQKMETKKPRTRIMVKYDVGFNNTLFLRGKGANLNWEQGSPLKNIKNDEWVWETDASFNTCEFKALINDTQFEAGENHPISCGASIQYTPKFE